MVHKHVNAIVVGAGAATGLCELRTRTIVSEVMIDDRGIARGVKYFSTLDDRAHEQTADLVVLAGGAMESARLLLNSKSKLFPDGAGNRHDWVGRNLQDHAYSGAHALFEEEIYDDIGPGATIAISGDLRYAQTMAFTTLMAFQIFNVFNARSDDRSAFEAMFHNRWLWGGRGLLAGAPCRGDLRTVPAKSLLDDGAESPRLAVVHRRGELGAVAARTGQVHWARGKPIGDGRAGAGNEPTGLTTLVRGICPIDSEGATDDDEAMDGRVPSVCPRAQFPTDNTGSESESAGSRAPLQPNNTDEPLINANER